MSEETNCRSVSLFVRTDDGVQVSVSRLHNFDCTRLRNDGKIYFDFYKQHILHPRLSRLLCLSELMCTNLNFSVMDVRDIEYRDKTETCILKLVG